MSSPRDPVVTTRRRILALSVAVMAVVALGGVGVAVPALYRTAVEGERARLGDVVRSDAAFIEAIAWDHAGDDAQTLARVLEARTRFEGLGATGDFALGRRAGDQIVFLLRERSGDAGQSGVAWGSERVEAMRRALRGEAGTVIGPGSAGEPVLAAYRPLPSLGWGVVAEVDKTNRSETSTSRRARVVLPAPLGAVKTTGAARVTRCSRLARESARLPP